MEYSNLHLQPPCGSESVGTYIGSAPRIETAARDKAISFLKNKKKTKLDECQKSVAIYTERKKKPWTFFFLRLRLVYTTVGPDTSAAQLTLFIPCIRSVVNRLRLKFFWLCVLSSLFIRSDADQRHPTAQHPQCLETRI